MEAASTYAKLRFMPSAVLMFCLLLLPRGARALNGEKPTTRIRHDSIAYFVSGQRIEVSARVDDDEGIKTVRCYFRADNNGNYLFVTMLRDQDDRYVGHIPAPSAETRSLEYLLLAVNGKDQVVRTEALRIPQIRSEKAPAWQCELKAISLPEASTRGSTRHCRRS